MRHTDDNRFDVARVGVAACVACCAAPLLGVLGGLGLAGAAGTVLVGGAAAGLVAIAGRRRDQGPADPHRRR